MAIAPGCEGRNYRCPRCGTHYTLGESFDHDRTTCVERDWHAEEGWIFVEELHAGDAMQGGGVVVAPAVPSKSGKMLHLTTSYNGVERVAKYRTADRTRVLVPARATVAPYAGTPA